MLNTVLPDLRRSVLRLSAPRCLGFVSHFLKDLGRLCKLTSCCSMSSPVGRDGTCLGHTQSVLTSASAGAYQQLHGLSL